MASGMSYEKAACGWIPARRAIAIDPARLLRE
jgi:ABC-type lipoprotein release transport system permease subunit